MSYHSWKIGTTLQIKKRKEFVWRMSSIFTYSIRSWLLKSSDIEWFPKISSKIFAVCRSCRIGKTANGGECWHAFHYYFFSTLSCWNKMLGNFRARYLFSPFKIQSPQVLLLDNTIKCCVFWWDVWKSNILYCCLSKIKCNLKNVSTSQTPP